MKVVNVMLPILLYIDPSVLGLFFIGGMVLLEKEQGILSLLYITPLKIKEYMISKILTLTIISMLVGVVISKVAYSGYVNIILLLVGILLTSIFYTLIGFIISTTSRSVNDYFVRMMPWMLLLVLPCFSLIPNDTIPYWMQCFIDIIPSVAGLKLVFGAFYHIPLWQIVIYIVPLIIFNYIAFIKAMNMFKNKVVLEG
jgi:fluoroquinolone transport system permease protein